MMGMMNHQHGQMAGIEWLLRPLALTFQKSSCGSEVCQILLRDLERQTNFRLFTVCLFLRLPLSYRLQCRL